MSRGRLGRGLAAIIPDEVRALPRPRTRDALRLVPIEQIRPDPARPRINLQIHALEDLASAIRNDGVPTPLLVRRDEHFEGGFVLLAGERRLRACALAGLDEVPCWIRENIDSREQLEQAIVDNVQRDDLDPIELAEALKRLVDEFELTQAEVARRVGKDRATVANAIRLLRLPDPAVEALRDGSISAGHGKALLALTDEAELCRAMDEVVAQGLSVRATERLVSSRLPGSGRRKPGPSPALQRLAERMGKGLGRRVRIEGRSRSTRGRIVIEYGSREDLDHLVDKIVGKS